MIKFVLMSRVLEDLKYTKQHEWLKIDHHVAIIGITDFAQHSLGDIVYLELKDSGTSVKAGDSIGTIESVKAAEDIYSPVSGIIIEKNESILQSPELINKDPYENWLVKIKDFNESDLQHLLNSNEYQKYLESLEQG